ncbi:MAG: DUF885 family protein [Vicinamibacterales bacterium]
MGEPAARVAGGPAAPQAPGALDRFFEVFYRQRPVTATFTGLHAHDDRLPDWSPDGLATMREEMADVRALLRRAGCPADDDVRVFPRDVDLVLADATLEIAIAELDSGHFVHSNPTLWTGEAIFGVLSLLTRDFAPLHDRLAAARARLEATPHFLAQARRAIPRVPKRWLAKATGECATAVTFLREALPAWLAALRADDVLRDQDVPGLTGAAAEAAAAFQDMQRWLGGFDAPGWPVPASDPEWGEAPSRECAGEALLSLLVRRGHGVTTPLETLLGEAEEALSDAAERLGTLCASHGGWAAVQDRLAARHAPAEGWLDRFQERWDDCRAAAERHALVTWPDAPLRYVPYPALVKDAAPQLYYLHYRSPAPFDPAATFDYVVPGLDGLTPAQLEARLRQWNDSVITLTWCTTAPSATTCRTTTPIAAPRASDRWRPWTPPPAARDVRERQPRRGLGLLRVRPHGRDRVPLTARGRGPAADAPAHRRPCRGRSLPLPARPRSNMASPRTTRTGR